MNFAITGKKIVSTQPEKKVILPLNNKHKTMLPAKEVNRIRKPSLQSNNKKNVQKVEIKKEQVKMNNQSQTINKKSQLKIQQPPILKAEQQIIEKQQLIKPQTKTFDITVRYNHYKDKFKTEENVLKYQVIEDKYGFASVFKGNYQPKLQLYRNYGNYIEPLTSGRALDYTWEIQEGNQYEITISQDEEEQSKYQKKAYIAPKQQNKCSIKKNKKVEELTQQMRGMKVQQLGSQKHKQLLQQRALQQMLFS